MIRELLRRSFVGLLLLRLMTWRRAWRSLGYLLRRRLLRRPVPGTAIIALTFDCQCRCGCCSSDIFRRYYAGRPGMTRAQILALIDRIARTASPRLHFTGGESLLHPHLLDAIRAASSRGLVCFVETNGIALDEAAVLGLKAAGVACVNVSLDSADPAAHDAGRGAPGCHARATAALRLCVAHGVACLVSTYATRSNVRDGGLAAVIGLARRLGCSGVRVLAAQPSGRWVDRMDVVLGPEDLALIRGQLPLTFPVLDRTALIPCPLRTGYKIFALPDGRLAPCEHLPYIFKDSSGMDLARLPERIARCPLFAKDYDCLPRDAQFRRDCGGLGGDASELI